MTDPSNIQEATRRTVLAGGVLGGLALTAEKAAAVSPVIGLDTPEERLKAYMLMRGALDERLVIGFVSGRYYGVVGDEIRPLYGVVGATFAKYRRRADGGYDGASYEVPFFTDLETGAALDHWRNPYTDEVVAVPPPQTAFPPAALIITPDLRIIAPKAPPGLVIQDRVLAPLRSGSDIWMTEETISALTIPGLPKPIRYSETVTLHASLIEVLAPGAKRVNCQTAYTSVVSWRPWLRMGDRPGHLMGNGSGRYGLRLEELPDNWRVAAVRTRPDVLADPAAPLASFF